MVSLRHCSILIGNGRTDVTMDAMAACCIAGRKLQSRGKG